MLSQWPPRVRSGGSTQVPCAAETMNLYIGLFLAFGAFFGLATFTRRHLFSEGPHQPTPSDASTRMHWAALAFWTLLCTMLWPIMVVSGLNTAWVLARRKARAQPPRF